MCCWFTFCCFDFGFGFPFGGKGVFVRSYRGLSRFYSVFGGFVWGFGFVFLLICCLLFNFGFRDFTAIWWGFLSYL